MIMINAKLNCVMTVSLTGVLNTFLSWNFFIPLGRLTYLNYLTHIIFIMVFAGSTPVQFYATDYFCVSEILVVFWRGRTQNLSKQQQNAVSKYRALI